MRIALVCPYAWDRPGGVQTHVRNLATQLRARGHQTLVVAPHWRRRETEDAVALVSRAVPLPANGSIAPISFGPLAATRVRAALRGFSPDVVHVHEPLIPSLSLLALWTEGGPMVGTFHAAAESSTGYRLARPLLARAARKLAVRTAVSDAARDLAARYFPGTYRMTPNGVDFERFATASPADLGPGRKVLFFGRIEQRKGLEVLVRAMSQLGDPEITLVVGGSGPDGRGCSRLARELGVHAVFLGPVSDADVPGVFKAADVYCAPGLRGESFGIVLIEAMAAGTPVVCSDLPAFRAVAGAAARLVSVGDPGAVAEGIRATLHDGDGSVRLRSAGRDVARAYDWRKLVVGVEAMYERARSGAR